MAHTIHSNLWLTPQSWNHLNRNFKVCLAVCFNDTSSVHALYDFTENHIDCIEGEYLSIPQTLTRRESGDCFGLLLGIRQSLSLIRQYCGLSNKIYEPERNKKIYEDYMKKIAAASLQEALETFQERAAKTPHSISTYKISRPSSPNPEKPPEISGYQPERTPETTPIPDPYSYDLTDGEGPWRAAHKPHSISTIAMSSPPSPSPINQQPERTPETTTRPDFYSYDFTDEKGQWDEKTWEKLEHDMKQKPLPSSPPPNPDIKRRLYPDTPPT